MDGIIAYILSKKYVNDTVIGMGAIKGAACQVQSINKVNKTTTITLEWEDNLGTSHTQSFDIEDGLDGVSVIGATIKSNGHLELTLSNGNSIDCGQVLPQYNTMPTPSASNEGQILQYIGTTTSSYTNGYFYQCINDDGVYKWVEKSVQDSYTKGQIGSLSDLPDTSKNVIENIANIKLSVDQLSASKLSISDIDNALSDVSENPVQNKVIKLTLDQLRGSILDALAEKEDIFRYNTLPSPSVDIENAIVQYIGVTNVNYTNGYYYQCVESPVGSGTYIWTQKNVQPNNGGGGGDGVVDGYYNPLNQLFYEDSSFLNPITGEDNTIYVDLNTNGLYRYDGSIFIKVSSSTDSYTKAEIGDLSDLPDTSKNVIENIDLLSENINLLDGSVLTIKTDITQLQGSLANKVDKITGKGLSTNDYTDNDKEKLVKLSPIYLIGSGLNLDSVTGELTASGMDVPIDTELSDTSINPVQNKVITTKIEQLEASKLSLSDVDNALSGSSINPVQNQVITLAINQLQGSVLNKIQKKLSAQEDNFAIWDNQGEIKDSGISKDVVPITASASNKLLVASDLSIKADKVIGAINDDIALLDGTGNLKDSTKKLSDLQDKLTESDSIDIDANNKISLKIDYLTASRVGYIPATEKGSNNGVAELDATGKVPSAQLPSYVDDVIEGYKDGTDFYTDSAHTQLITPESGKIYVDLHTDTTWRWSGTAYVQISESLALGETSTTAYRGDRGKTAYDHSQITDGSNPHNTTADNINLKVPIPALSGSKLDVESTLYGINTELGKKADKISTATQNDIAIFDANGGVADSGKKTSDFISKSYTYYGTVDTKEELTTLLNARFAELNADEIQYFSFNDHGNLISGGTFFCEMTKAQAGYGTAILYSYYSYTRHNVYYTACFNGTWQDIMRLPRVNGTTETGNIASFDSKGNLTDSGKKASELPAIAPTPASGLTESDIVDEVNGATATNANAPSLYGVQKYSNEKTVRRVLNGANIPSGTSMTATGIGTWFDGDISTIVPSTDEADWWYDSAFIVPVYYVLTSDTSIVTGKTYYTISGTAPNYTYTVVASPVVADIGTYYEQYSDDIELSFKFDPSSGEPTALGGYILDTTTGKLCIKFANSITPLKARIAVDITYTRNEVV